MGNLDHILTTFRMRNYDGFWMFCPRALDAGLPQHVVRWTNAIVDGKRFVGHLVRYPMPQVSVRREEDLVRLKAFHH